MTDALDTARGYRGEIKRIMSTLARVRDETLTAADVYSDSGLAEGLPAVVRTLDRKGYIRYSKRFQRYLLTDAGKRLVGGARRHRGVLARDLGVTV